MIFKFCPYIRRITTNHSDCYTQNSQYCEYTNVKQINNIDYSSSLTDLQETSQNLLTNSLALYSKLTQINTNLDNIEQDTTSIKVITDSTNAYVESLDLSTTKITENTVKILNSSKEIVSTLEKILTSINNINSTPRYVQNAVTYSYYSNDTNEYLFTNRVANYKPDITTRYGVFYFDSGFTFPIPENQILLKLPPNQVHDVIYPDGSLFVVDGYFEISKQQSKSFKALNKYLKACQISH